MDDPLCRQFFSQPQHPYQRQYEALRAVFIDGQLQKDVAESFGYSYDHVRQLVCQFRQQCHTQQASPFFEMFL